MCAEASHSATTVLLLLRSSRFCARHEDFIYRCTKNTSYIWHDAFICMTWRIQQRHWPHSRSRRNPELQKKNLGIYARSGVDSPLASGFVRGLGLLQLHLICNEKWLVNSFWSKCFMPWLFLTTISSASGMRA